MTLQKCESGCGKRFPFKTLVYFEAAALVSMYSLLPWYTQPSGCRWFDLWPWSWQPDFKGVEEKERKPCCLNGPCAFYLGLSCVLHRNAHMEVAVPDVTCASWQPISSFLFSLCYTPTGALFLTCASPLLALAATLSPPPPPARSLCLSISPLPSRSWPLTLFVLCLCHSLGRWLPSPLAPYGTSKAASLPTRMW